MLLLFSLVDILLKPQLQKDFIVNIISDLTMPYKLHFVSFDQSVIKEDPFTYPLKFPETQDFLL